MLQAEIILTAHLITKTRKTRKHEMPRAHSELLVPRNNCLFNCTPLELVIIVLLRSNLGGVLLTKALGQGVGTTSAGGHFVFSCVFVLS